MEKAAPQNATDAPSLGEERIVLISHLYEPKAKIADITQRYPGISVEFYHVGLDQVQGWAEKHRGEKAKLRSRN